MSVNPRDFTSGEEAPRRIGGTEIEADTQFGDETARNTNDYRLLDPTLIANIGLISHNNGYCWLTNGGNLHGDVSRVEFSTGESDNARELAAAKLAGHIIIDNLAAGGGARAYRHSGTMICGDFKTLGQHENRLTVARAATGNMLAVVDAHQATRVWAWGGMVGPSGYELSQKARGIGAPSSFSGGLRTKEGSKPMGWLKVSDTDVFNVDSEGHSPWARSESRVVDGIFSRWALWMSEAAGSLVLRLVERSDVLGHKLPLSAIQLINPVNSLRMASRDLTFKTPMSTRSGELLNVIDFNNRLAEYGDHLRNRIVLPADEYRAVDELFDICDRLRRTNILKGYLAPLMGRVDFAPRLAYLLKLFPMSEINSYNIAAVDRSLLWSRTQPVGPGATYWNNLYEKGKAPDPIGDTLIAECRDIPCERTRSAIRGEAIADPEIRERVANIYWQMITGSYAKAALAPYQNDISVLDKIRYDRKI